MKISMVIVNTSPVIYDARVRKEATALAAAGHDVTLLALTRNGEPGLERLGVLRVQLMALHSRRFPRWRVVWPVRYGEFLVRSALRLVGHRADVYHAHDLDALPPAWMAARITGARVVYDSHELFTERPIEAPWLWRRIERALLKDVDAVLTASAERADIMYKEYGARQLPTPIVNCPEAVKLKGDPGLRAALPPALRDRRLVLYQGALGGNRCLEQLVLSAREFDPNTLLALLGTQTEFVKQVLRPLVDRHGLQERVPFIASADIGVVIYRNNCRNNYYCAPNKLYDYCMARLAVVGCDFPPVRALIERHQVGALFDPEDSSSIACAVNGLLRDAAELARVRSQAEAVSAVHNWNSEAGKLVDLYATLPSRRRR